MEHFVKICMLVLASGICVHSVMVMEPDESLADVVDGPLPGKLEIIYPGGVEVKFGSELTPTQVKDQPTVKWAADSDKYYLLSMIDPDAPSKENPTFSEVNHWLVGNIQGSDLNSGEVIVEYRGSGPPKGSGLHRYIFLVYEQPGKLKFDEPHVKADSREGRFNFSHRRFAKKYGLKSPVFAGNYFQAQWDPYVDERNKNTTG